MQRATNLVTMKKEKKEKKGKKRKKRKEADYHFRDLIKLPDILTLANAFCGFLAMVFVLYRSFTIAMILLPAAFFFDLFDGYVARRIKRQGEFGMHLDSMSDLVSFGVAPVLFGVVVLPLSLLTIFSLAFFLLAGILRLARFEIMRSRSLFLGLPISISGVLFPLLYFLNLNSNFYTLVYLILGATMISHLVVRRFKVRGVEV
ncbi:MAG: CDP-diacylglycerol--serine O-phosphatidyltransferase [Candidatus Methanophagaceae archaeon]|nr:MAG: CDP-diacylglycerol--serine O-phosphatidyltransferase [Methanophagales archaeon]HDN68700.1 CDP-diacylglycerol--serine O-phosphatidyltransferase [Methanomicrobia archaeon]